MRAARYGSSAVFRFPLDLGSDSTMNNVSEALPGFVA